MPSYSKIQDIKPLSLDEFKKIYKFVTGRSFDEEGENRCEILYMSAHLIDLRFFVTVMMHPVLRRSVRRFVVDTSTHNPDLAKMKVFRRLAEQQNSQPFNKVSEYPFLKDGNDRTNEWYRSSPTLESTEKREAEMHAWWVENQFHPHLDILENDLDFKLVLHALNANLFPNLIALDITHLPFEEETNVRDRPYSPPSRSPNVQMMQEAFPGPQPIHPAQIAPRVSWTFSPGAGYDARDPHQLWRGTFESIGPYFHPTPVNVPLRCMDLTLTILENAHIKELSVIPGQQALDWLYPQDLLEASGLSLLAFILPEYAPRLTHRFTHLEVLRLKIDCMDDSDIDLGSTGYDGLRKALSGAKKLKVLYLDLERHQGMGGFDILDCIQSLAIQEIHLRGAVVTAPGLCKLLVRSPNLRRLILFTGSISTRYGPAGMPAYWWPILDEARKGGLLGNIEIFIDEVAQSTVAKDLVPVIGKWGLAMPGEPGLEEGIRRWRTWQRTSNAFPLVPIEPNTPSGESLRDSMRKEVLKAKASGLRLTR
ncbi:hypothetical protein IWX90DRAFT_516001 [Phyllosticta citrichinensis]|uniref:Uncharacterized protein n=1 Tax=Phyllosticta citrichinensis TaxID=1130410 RepID=A0ABR1XKT7_9PEZI